MAMEPQSLTGDHIKGTRFSFSEDDEHIYSVAVSPDGLYVAAVFGNGALRIMDASSLCPVARAASGAPYTDLPCTSVKWLPQYTHNAYRLASVSCGGALFGWDFNGERLDRTHHVEEHNNELATVDVDKAGNQILTAGSDRIVRLYSTKFELIAELHDGFLPDGARRSTHTNRVFSARFVTPTLAASAGWESPIQLWDLRTHRSDRQISSALASSDCLEPVANTTLLLVATGDAERPVQLFDTVTGVLREHESSRLCTGLANLPRIVASRVSEAAGLVWCLSVSQSAVFVASLSSGQIVARIDLPFVGMNLCLHPQIANTAFVAGQHANLAVLTLVSQ